LKGYCITHRKDVDGLGSAAIAKAATGGDVILSDYDDLVPHLRRIPYEADRLVVTDLGSDTADFPGFLQEMRRIAGVAKVTYIDHHYMSSEAIRKLRKAKVEVIHDVKECASMLTYRTFKSDVSEGARLIALCGAVTDYLDDSPMAKKMMEREDRQFVLLEATMLALALGKNSEKPGYADMIVEELSKMKRPHEIVGVPEASVEQLRIEASLVEKVKSGGTKSGRLAYMVTTQYSTGNIAKLLIGAFDVQVGVAMKEKQEGWYEVSLRGTSDCRVHLGRTIAVISAKLGGSGGGHRKAAGCRVPSSKADEMIRVLTRRV
jgi:RecJ-like exonuclease